MPDALFTTPPIPVHLAHFPMIGGLVIPFITLRHRTGTAALGLVDGIRLEWCLYERRCGVCGEVIRGRMVFLVRAIDLVRKCSAEPALCPPCAAYTQHACPMVSGYMDHYRRQIAPFVTRRCGDDQCSCRLWEPSQADSNRLGAPAEQWYTLWTLHYNSAHDADGQLVAAFDGGRVLKVREIGRNHD